MIHIIDSDSRPLTLLRELLVYLAGAGTVFENNNKRRGGHFSLSARKLAHPSFRPATQETAGPGLGLGVHAFGALPATRTGAYLGAQSAPVCCWPAAIVTVGSALD